MEIGRSVMRSIGIFVLFAVAGCSSDNSNGSFLDSLQGGTIAGSPSELAGRWNGSATDMVSGDVFVAQAFIDRFGQTQVMVLPRVAVFTPGPPATSPGPVIGIGNPAIGFLPEPAISSAATIFVVYGNVCCGSNYAGQLVGEPLGTADSSASQLSLSLSSTVSSQKLVGDLKYAGRTYSLSLSADPNYTQGVTLRDLAGVYTAEVSNSAGGITPLYTLAITSDGVITGSHVNGCIYNGQVSIPDTSYNMFRVDMQLANCGTANYSWLQNGQYSGVGTLLKNVVNPSQPDVPRQAFYYSLIGPTWLGPQAVLK